MEEFIRKLMYPRFEVIALYPDSTYNLGRVIDNSSANAILKEEDPEELGKYPGIFRELAWHENRTLFEMMQIRFIETVGNPDSSHYVPGVKLQVLQFYFTDLDTVEPKFKSFIVRGSSGQAIVEILPHQCKPITKLK